MISKVIRSGDTYPERRERRMSTEEQGRRPDLDRIRELDRAAVLAAAAVACRIRSGDLGRPTPCDGGDGAGLAAPLSVQHRGFAAAARGEGGDLAVWAARPPAPDPVADFLAATADVLTTFGAGPVGGRPVRLAATRPT